jgi:hypothetical protein
VHRRVAIFLDSDVTMALRATLFHDSTKPERLGIALDLATKCLACRGPNLLIYAPNDIDRSHWVQGFRLRAGG